MINLGFEKLCTVIEEISKISWRQELYTKNFFLVVWSRVMDVHISLGVFD